MSAIPSISPSHSPLPATPILPICTWLTPFHLGDLRPVLSFRTRAEPTCFDSNILLSLTICHYCNSFYSHCPKANDIHASGNQQDGRRETVPIGGIQFKQKFVKRGRETTDLWCYGSLQGYERSESLGTGLLGLWEVTVTQKVQVEMFTTPGWVPQGERGLGDKRRVGTGKPNLPGSSSGQKPGVQRNIV